MIFDVAMNLFPSLLACGDRSEGRVEYRPYPAWSATAAERVSPGIDVDTPQEEEREGC